jgi:hypothetical protein
VGFFLELMRVLDGSGFLTAVAAGTNRIEQAVINVDDLATS